MEFDINMRDLISGDSFLKDVRFELSADDILKVVRSLLDIYNDKVEQHNDYNVEKDKKYYCNLMLWEKRIGGIE